MRLPAPSLGRTAVGPVLFAFFAMAAVSFVIAALVIAGRHDPDRTDAAGEIVAPYGLDRIQVGASEQDVRETFGHPSLVRGGDSTVTDHCLVYRNLPSEQRVYRFCFQGGKLKEISPQ